MLEKVTGFVSLILGSILFDILKNEFDSLIKNKNLDNILNYVFFLTEFYYILLLNILQHLIEYLL